MLLLTSTTDRLQIVTSSAANINVHASWVDTNTGTGTITPGRTNTVIAAAATTNVAGGGPASGVQRNVKTLHVRNADASLSCDVTVQHTDGTNVAQLHKRTLQPGDALEYTDQGGFVAPVTTTFLALGGKLSLVSATQLNFAPQGGDRIRINGQAFAIPPTGIPIANTGVNINGTPGSNLAANTTYLVGLSIIGGTAPTPFFSTTITHAPSTSAANAGTEIVNGNDNISLIGMVRTNASAQFVDSAAQRFLRSWFTRRARPLQTGQTNISGFSTSGPVIDFAGYGSKAEFVCWSDDPIQIAAVSFSDASPGGDQFFTFCNLDGVALGAETIVNPPGPGTFVCATSIANFLPPAEGYHYMAMSAGSSSPSNHTVYWTIYGWVG